MTETEKQITDKELRRSTSMYTCEACLEYLVATLVAGSYLATLTKSLNMSDSLTAILSAGVSLGCFFQLFSLFIRPKRAKQLVIILSILNKLFFSMLYVIPIVPFTGRIKTAVFIIFIFLAYLLYNLAHPKKINWLMSLVDDKRRGSFTANKEIISLLGEMVFSFGMGVMIDRFKERGELRIAFVLSALIMLILTFLHTFMLVFSVEKEIPRSANNSLKTAFMKIIKNKRLLSVTLIFVLYRVAVDASVPFYGTYLIGELGLSLKFISLGVMVSSISRILVSKFWGRYADKNSFAKMVEKCFIFLGLSYIAFAFVMPSNAKAVYLIHLILYGISLGGINSALINLVFDYVSMEHRADSLAITQSISGVAGFLTTLCISPLVTFIQNCGNTFFGMPIYAQQLVSIISFVVALTAIIFTRWVFIGRCK